MNTLYSIFFPNADSASSTASSAVRLCSSMTEFTSTLSKLSRCPSSAVISWPGGLRDKWRHRGQAYPRRARLPDPPTISPRTRLTLHALSTEESCAVHPNSTEYLLREGRNIAHGENFDLGAHSATAAAGEPAPCGMCRWWRATNGCPTLQLRTLALRKG
jgi:hypothetical protein